MSFILSFYFKLLAIFKCYALQHLTVVYVSPLHSHHAMQLLFPVPNPHTPLSLQPANKIDPNRSVCTSSHSTCLLHTTFLSAHPSFRSALQLFPSTFFILCLLITQTKTLLPSHKIATYFVPNKTPVTFSQNVIQFSTSTPLRLPSTPQLFIDFRPTFLISTLINIMLLIV